MSGSGSGSGSAGEKEKEKEMNDDEKGKRILTEEEKKEGNMEILEMCDEELKNLEKEKALLDKDNEKTKVLMIEIEKQRMKILLRKMWYLTCLRHTRPQQSERPSETDLATRQLEEMHLGDARNNADDGKSDEKANEEEVDEKESSTGQRNK